LKENDVLEILGTDYTMTQHNIPEEQNPQTWYSSLLRASNIIMLTYKE
jgi:hypothetical protein